MRFFRWKYSPVENVFSYFFAYLTFTPGVEEHVDIFLGVIDVNTLAFCTPGADCELVFSDDSRGRRVDWQLDAIGVLLHNLGFPAQVLQLLHERNDDVRALRHQRQWAFKGKKSVCWRWWTMFCFLNFNLSIL